jgi:hypothetical protein
VNYEKEKIDLNESLEKILTQIKDNNIVCPSPSTWVNFYSKIGGYEEESDDFDGYNLRPMVLSAWYVTSKEDKHNRFISSLKYFYKKYPDKRKYIENLLKKHDDWFRWDDR